ncbi:Uu.00g029390.m01.CDS01 [Anthostomella pinea]|uniref:Uu.00g029390.m01.CDS01 n=1 Tax=Anthostomella pinea TaxID=933095 RepID=A0AAI8YCT1_9PEZI|nr:Uu.00g029390.m01.CDS01 [Anthostomella pinea]
MAATLAKLLIFGLLVLPSDAFFLPSRPSQGHTDVESTTAAPNRAGRDEPTQESAPISTASTSTSSDSNSNDTSTSTSASTPFTTKLPHHTHPGSNIAVVVYSGIETVGSCSFAAPDGSMTIQPVSTLTTQTSTSTDTAAVEQTMSSVINPAKQWAYDRDCGTGIDIDFGIGIGTGIEQQTIKKEFRHPNPRLLSPGVLTTRTRTRGPIPL